jgi:hypothetical protein
MSATRKFRKMDVVLPDSGAGRLGIVSGIVSVNICSPANPSSSRGAAMTDGRAATGILGVVPAQVPRLVPRHRRSAQIPEAEL